jgi:hypothetical protein
VRRGTAHATLPVAQTAESLCAVESGAPQLGSRVRFTQWNAVPDSDDCGLRMSWEGMVSNVLTPPGPCCYAVCVKG